MTSIRSNMESIFVFVDCIALLDMLASFAESVLSTSMSGGGDADTFCRPQLQESGPLIVKDGRHPIVSCIQVMAGQRDNHFISNDTFMNDTETFHIITGCNGSGI